MTRAIFLALYIPVALFLSGQFGSVWTVTIMALAIGQKGAAALLSPVFVVSVLGPIVLVVLAYIRGKKINNRKLVWFPVIAFILTLMPLAFALLAKPFSSPGQAGIGAAVTMYPFMITAAASTAGPIILHTICCVLGGKNESRNNREDASTRIDRVYETINPE